MAGRNTVRDIDRGYRKLHKNLADGGAVSMLVGVQGKEADEAHQESEQTVGEVASINELGLGVPERSFLRAWVDENEAAIMEDLRDVMRGVLAGRFTKEQGMQLLGVKYVAAIQERITAGIEPPNAPYTIAKKGSSTPLIDTGQLKSAITFLLEAMISSMTGGGVTL